MKTHDARIKETPFFFELGDEKLFGFLHQPATSAIGAIVMCHAFAEEKLWSHRVYVTFAREMASQGYGVLRFDMRGEGDSAREFEETSVETRVEDTLRAIDIAREKIGHHRVVLVGHRLGGSIAAAAAARDPGRVASVVVWDPIVDGADYFSTLLRSNMATQMATTGKVTRTRDALVESIVQGEIIVADGYGLGAALYREMSALQWSTRADFFQRPLLVLEVAKVNQTEASRHLQDIASAHHQVRIELASEPPFWRETRQFHRRASSFTAHTLSWLQATQAVAA